MKKQVAATVGGSSIGTGLLMLGGFSAVFYVCYETWKLLKFGYYKVKGAFFSGLDFGATVLFIVICGIAVLLLLGVLSDVLRVVVGRIFSHSENKKRSGLLSVGTLAELQKKVEGTVLGQIFCAMLAIRYLEVYGKKADSSAFVWNPAEYSAFKSHELWSLAHERYRPLVEGLYQQIHALYNAGNEALRKILEPAISEMCRRKAFFFITGRILYYLSFHRLGYSPTDGYSSENPAVWASSPSNFSKLMWKHFWTNAAEIEKCGIEFTCDLVEPQKKAIEAIEEPEEQDVELPTSIVPAGDAEFSTIPPEPMAEEEVKDEEDNSEEENLRLENESVKTAINALSCFEHFRDKAWDFQNADETLSQIEANLTIAEEHHPDKDFVRSKIAWVQGLRERFPDFVDDYKRAMSLGESDDLPVWLETAICTMDKELLDKADFKRCCLVSFLLSEPQETVEDEESEPTTEEPAQTGIVQSIGF